MTEIAKSDFFFTITSISVIGLTVIVAILLFYVISVNRNVKKIVSKVKEESDNAIEDIREIRAKIKSDGSTIRGVSMAINLVKNIFSSKKSKRNKKD